MTGSTYWKHNGLQHLEYLNLISFPFDLSEEIIMLQGGIDEYYIQEVDGTDGLMIERLLKVSQDIPIIRYCGIQGFRSQTIFT